MFIVHNINEELRPVPIQRYRIKVRVGAKNTPPVTAIFESWLMTAGYDVFFSSPFRYRRRTDNTSSGESSKLSPIPGLGLDVAWRLHWVKPHPAPSLVLKLS
jgi:hypothetical protein